MSHTLGQIGNKETITQHRIIHIRHNGQAAARDGQSGSTSRSHPLPPRERAEPEREAKTWQERRGAVCAAATRERRGVRQEERQGQAREEGPGRSGGAQGQGKPEAAEQTWGKHAGQQEGVEAHSPGEGADVTYGRPCHRG